MGFHSLVEIFDSSEVLEIVPRLSFRAPFDFAQGKTPAKSLFFAWGGKRESSRYGVQSHHTA
jgi:hypothetical protein